MRKVLVQKAKSAILLGFISMFCGFMASAQVAIRGSVRDAAAKGLPGISVSVNNTNFATASTANGEYSLQTNLKPGTYVNILR